MEQLRFHTEDYVYPREGGPRIAVPAKFKPVLGRYPNVKGGRWKVRRYTLREQRSHGNSAERPWRAWTEGLAKDYSCNFATHAEAIAWANDVALAIKFGNKLFLQELDTLIADAKKRNRSLRWDGLDIARQRA